MEETNKKSWNILKTDHLKHAMPRLPIPELESTCKKYLQSQKTVLSKTRYLKTEKNVKEFLSGIGPELQKRLKETEGRRPDNYLADIKREQFLMKSGPLNLGQTIRSTLALDDDEMQNRQDLRAANQIISTLKIHLDIKRKNYPPKLVHLKPGITNNNIFLCTLARLPSKLASIVAKYTGVVPLCMDQYNYFMGVTRKARTGRDEMVIHSDSKHIIVMRRGYFYKLEVLDNYDNIINHRKIHSAICEILKDNRKMSSDAVAMVTHGDRNYQSPLARQLLLNSGKDNKRMVDLIDSSLFVMCLDDSKNTNDYVETSLNNFYSTPENRWADKTIYLTVNKSGWIVCNSDHTYTDGLCVSELADSGVGVISKNPSLKSNDVKFIAPLQHSPITERLDFSVSNELKSLLKEIKSDYYKLADDISFSVLDYDIFGKEQGLSNDCLMQIALNMTVLRLHEKFLTCHEPAASIRFAYGRTDGIRPLTSPVKQICELLNNNINNPDFVGDNSDQLNQLLHKCSRIHRKQINDVNQGEGWERHLMCLFVMAKRSGLPMPNLFVDGVYEQFNAPELFSSAIPITSNTQYSFFGPLHQNSWNIGYNCKEGVRAITIMANKSWGNTEEFKCQLIKNLDLLKNIVLN